MNPFSGIGLTLAVLAAIFVYGYGKGHRSCEAKVTVIKSSMDNIACRATLGSVREIEDGIVVCVKTKRA